MKQLPLRLLLLVVFLSGSGLLASSAHATTTCSATSPTLSFGTVSTSGTTDVSATFSVTCSTFGLSLLANAKVRMCLGIGDGDGGIGHFRPRRMRNAMGDTLDFQIYTDAARTQVWGSRGNPTVPDPRLVEFDYAVPVLGGSQTTTITMYGRVPTQALVAGTYASTFAGVHTRMDYRYDEVLLGTATYPPSCATGGDGGASVSGAFPFTASATVPANCRAYAATRLDFGSVPGVIVENIDRTSTITMTCAGRTAWKVGLNNGLHANGSTRRMRLGTSTSFVRYELYREPARTSRWGNMPGTDTVDGTGTGSAQTLTVHGRVPATQTPAAGTYGDTVTVTITY